MIRQDFKGDSFVPSVRSGKASAGLAAIWHGRSFAHGRKVGKGIGSRAWLGLLYVLDTVLEMML